MNLKIHNERYAICRLSPDAVIPTWAKGNFVSITRTKDELSIVCAETNVLSDIQAVRNWSLMQVEGPMDLSIVGVLASLTKPLADAGINLFAVATYDTDYLLVPEAKLAAAKAALEHAGHQFVL